MCRSSRLEDAMRNDDLSDHPRCRQAGLDVNVGLYERDEAEMQGNHRNHAKQWGRGFP